MLVPRLVDDRIWMLVHLCSPNEISRFLVIPDSFSSIGFIFLVSSDMFYNCWIDFHKYWNRHSCAPKDKFFSSFSIISSPLPKLNTTEYLPTCRLIYYLSVILLLLNYYFSIFLTGCHLFLIYLICYNIFCLIHFFIF